MQNHSTKDLTQADTSAKYSLDQALEHIRAALTDLRFGHVSIIVQDGVVIQVERTERKRLRGTAH